MHIVFVTTELATRNNSSGGLASFTANIARIFKENGHDITILLASVKDEKIEFDKDITLETTFIKKYIWSLFDCIAKIFALFTKEERKAIRQFFLDVYRSRQVKKKIKEINRKNKINIVHYCEYRSVALYAKDRIPYVIRMSGVETAWRDARLPIATYDYENILPSIKEKLNFYTIRKSRFVISPSQLVANMIEKQLNVKVEVIESPYKLCKNNWNCYNYSEKLKGKKYILHYGSLQYLKGTHIVAELVKRLLEKYTNMYIVLAGISTDMLDELGQKIKAHELVARNAGEYADRVIYMGKLVREELYPVIENAELCLLPSRIENLSNACIEAMAMGKIIIATNGASYEQLIDDRISGFLCERDNAESFMQGIEEALGLSIEEKERMKEKAIERANQLNPDIIYEKYLDYYKHVISKW